MLPPQVCGPGARIARVGPPALRRQSTPRLRASRGDASTHGEQSRHGGPPVKTLPAVLVAVAVAAAITAAATGVRVSHPGPAQAAATAATAVASTAPAPRATPVAVQQARPFFSGAQAASVFSAQPPAEPPGTVAPAPPAPLAFGDPAVVSPAPGSVEPTATPAAAERKAAAAAAVEAVLPEFYDRAQELFARSGVPGAALVVVAGDRAVYVDCFGVREAGRPGARGRAHRLPARLGVQELHLDDAGGARHAARAGAGTTACARTGPGSRSGTRG